MNQTVAAALISVALHVNALSGSGLGWRRVFVMAIGDGIPVRAVKVRIVTGDLCKVGVGRAAERVRKDEVEEDTSGVSQAFSLPNGGGSERNGEGFGSKDVEEVKSCGGRITGEQRLDVVICT